MAEESVLRRVRNCVVNLEFEDIKSVVKEALEADIRPEEIIDAMSKGMDIVGERYEKHEYFLTELIMAGETMKAGLEPLLPYIETMTAKYKGVVVMGTVKGDIHDIGKNIVVAFLTSAGFKVHDLGVDVPAEKFVKKAIETKAEIVGISTIYSVHA
ncbi:MAG: Dimethylamine corrinoid protein [Candidatus Bathyarchaeota archaeon BA1]|nr:MAG: Dimethylamine corrinoid protein [Candidatus Bathyarchaeota archaeon BA1]